MKNKKYSTGKTQEQRVLAEKQYYIMNLGNNEISLTK